jgi:hypothetical protein
MGNGFGLGETDRARRPQGALGQATAGPAPCTGAQLSLRRERGHRDDLPEAAPAHAAAGSRSHGRDLADCGTRSVVTQLVTQAGKDQRSAEGSGPSDLGGRYKT